MRSVFKVVLFIDEMFVIEVMFDCYCCVFDG